MGDNGAASHMVHAMFDQVMPPRGDSGSESAADGDVSSVLSSTQGEGERRVVSSLTVVYTTRNSIFASSSFI